MEADFPDLISTGTVGLIRALESFDPTKGTPFPSFARLAVSGAMKDGLRKEDRVSRKVREESDRLRIETERAVTILGRLPSEFELASLAATTISRLREVLAATAAVGSLSELASPDGREVGDLVADPAAEERATRAQLADLAAAVLGRLSARKQAVVRWYHLEGVNLKEIGSRLGISESRVSQLHSEALQEARLWGRGHASSED